MKPRVAFFTSGPAACAMCAPNGNSAFSAPIRAALPALALRNDLRLIRSPAEFFRAAFLLISNAPSVQERFFRVRTPRERCTRAPPSSAKARRWRFFVANGAKPQSGLHRPKHFKFYANRELLRGLEQNCLFDRATVDLSASAGSNCCKFAQRTKTHQSPAQLMAMMLINCAPTYSTILQSPPNMAFA
jgi:hypothetical protein